MILLLAMACVSNRGVVEVPLIAVPSAESEFSDGPIIGDIEVATLHVRDLHFEEPQEVSLVERLNPISSARAHPGHELDGNLAGELLGTWTVDLLGGPVELGTATLFEGEFATSDFDLVHAAISGTVDLGSGPEPFSYELDFDEEVAGIDTTFDIDVDAPPTALCLSIDTAGLLFQTAWAEEPDIVENTVRFGVLSTRNYAMETNTCSP